MAATGLLAVLVWFGGVGLLVFAGVGGTDLGFVFGVGLLYLPLAVPVSFVVGTLLWRKLYPERDREFYGAVFGGATAIASLAGGSLGPAALIAGSNAIRGEMALPEAIVFGALLVPIGFFAAVLAAGWLVVPIGVLGGWYHERAKVGS